MVAVLYLYMWAENKKRDRKAAVCGSGLSEEQEKEAIEQGMQDVTLEEWAILSDVKAHTSAYLKSARVSKQLDTLASSLVANLGRWAV